MNFDLIRHTHLTHTHSTNSQLIEWITRSYQDQAPLFHARPHASRPYLLTADCQSSGRGQHGRTWQSPLGNVYLSLYVPTAALSQTREHCLTQPLDGRLSLCVGYQLSQMSVIQDINQHRKQQQLPRIGVKWVNDVGFYDKKAGAHIPFQKIAGILIEPVSVAGTLLGVVVGVGLNVMHAPTLTNKTQEGLNYQAVSLQDLTNKPLSVQPLYAPMVAAIMQALAQFNGFAAPTAMTEFIAAFDQQDVLKDKLLHIAAPIAQQAISGTANGIDERGCLLVADADGSIRQIWTGTIQVLSP